MNENPDAALQGEVPPIPRPEDMPDASAMELNYLVDPIKDYGEIAKITFTRYSFIALAGFILTFIGYLFGDFLASHEGFIILLTIGPFLGWSARKLPLGIEKKKITAKHILLLFFSPFLIGFILILIYYIGTRTSTWLTFFAAIGLLILSYHFLNHIRLAINAHPENTIAPDGQPIPSPGIGQFVHSTGFVFAIFVAILVPSSFTLIALLSVAGFALSTLREAKKNNPHLDWSEFIRCLIRACYAWIALGHGQTTHHPGVFKPPKNTVWRIAATSIVTITLSVGLLPSVSYFPVAYQLLPTEFFTKPYIELHQQNDGTFGFKNLSSTLLAEKAAGFQLDTSKLKRPPPENAKGSEIRAYQAEFEAWEKSETERFFRETPFGVIWLMLDIGFAKHAIYLVTTLISFFLCLLAPIGIVLITFAISLVGAYPETLSDVEYFLTPPKLSPEIWRLYVWRMRNSNDALERQHLLLGEHHPSGIPILLDQSILNGHAYISGDTGSGKTSLGIMPLLVQLMMKTDRQADPAKRLDASFVIIDLKGDPALFNTAKALAEASGLPFRWFTSESGRSSYAFNPLDQRAFNELSEIAMTELQMAALSLEHGEGYGKSYFSRRARNWLYRAMSGETFQKNAKSKTGQRPKSFIELNKLAMNFMRNDKIDPKEKEHTYEILSLTSTLAAFPQLNPQDPEVIANAIDMADVIATPQVVYFWLPASISSASVREIGKLALYSLLAAAYQRSVSQEPMMNTYCFIDEFQRIIAENFKLILQQARSMHIPMILSNQTPTDLRDGTTDYFPTIQGNTRFWQSFAAGDLFHQDMLIKCSGETLRNMLSGYVGAPPAWMTASEIIRPLLSKNHILEMTDDDWANVVHIKRGAGYSRYLGYPLLNRSTYSMLARDYQELSRMAWPDGNSYTITMAKNTTKPADTADPNNEEPDENTNSTAA